LGTYFGFGGVASDRDVPQSRSPHSEHPKHGGLLPPLLPERCVHLIGVGSQTE
jgi:hypothetical protein